MMMSGETSGAVKKGISVRNESRKCAERFWKIFPHLILCGSLVAYAALGALIFQHIEGGTPSRTEREYHKFLTEVVHIVQNDTNNSSCSHECVLRDVKDKMKEFRSIWFQRPSRWTFFNSMFFCCTVFTTVGYGDIYPVTSPGKVVCVLYAMVGIPLMLLVILDVGDFLAFLMSRAYIRLHKLFQDFCSRTWSPWKAPEKVVDSSHQAFEDATFAFSQDVVIREPLDIRQVISSQADVRHKSMQLENNKEIFEKLLERENLIRKSPLLRTLSCPELDRLPPPPRGHAIWDFTGLGDEMETLNVPFLLILLIVFAYICFGLHTVPYQDGTFSVKAAHGKF
ncbi:potassium channel subfamily K member 18 isoform X2 [Melanotaenia boesemani]|uniref:potassium channel subfamily K member 18 isoform X2 n=1 Tax=Melanotaenia boesemani TaxID=1250792 RepID=UPI001C04AEEE|nr:potassium channel subfamily K member 18 isoform X2 [Melanotaenia boesemani]